MKEDKTKYENNVFEEITEDDLNNVTGGSNLSLHFFDTEAEVKFILFPGDIVYVKESIFSKKVRCEVIRCEKFYDPQYHCYEDLYIVRDPDDLLRRVLRDDIVNEAD